MRRYAADWKKTKSPVMPPQKSFRESIDFPDECFRSPKAEESLRRGSRRLRLRKHGSFSDSCRDGSLRSTPIRAAAFSKSEAKKVSGRSLTTGEKLVHHEVLGERDSSEVSSAKTKAQKTSTSAAKLKDFSLTFNSSFDEDLLKDSNSDNLSNPSNVTSKSDKKTSSEKFCISAKKENSNISEAVLGNCKDESSNANNKCMSSVSKDINNDLLDLSKWGLPESVVDAYEAQNITTMFQWQAECLSLPNVLKGGNLVYSAPTSAGKTLVAEILMLKKVLESKKKGLMILPYVSVAREKVNYLQMVFQDAGISVDGYMGAYNPPGGFNVVDIAICTIEKANNLINRLMEDGRIAQLGIVVVDELHMLGDPHRGYLLELLLTKLLYACKKNDLNHVQIVGMSATLPNLNVLALWLSSELYHTTFRPVPLAETFKVGSHIYDSKTSHLIRDLKHADLIFPNDADHTIYLAVETVVSGHSVLIFCPSKAWCEKLAESIAREVFRLGSAKQDETDSSSSRSAYGSRLREVLNGSDLKDVLDQLTNSPAGLDSVLARTVPFGVAFHHAGLTFDEREIIESAFRLGIVKFLVATSTLSSGVNLPAKRVIIRSPLFRGSLIDVLSYKQMVGRAGRKGIDTSGESILVCKENERNAAKALIESDLRPVRSCLIMSGDKSLHSSIKRAILEIVASGVARTIAEILQYMSCTLLSASAAAEEREKSSDIGKEDVDKALKNCLQYLIDNEFIFPEGHDASESSEKSYQPTRLGQAVLASGFSPDDSLRMLKELQRARQCFVLDNDLHILYEVTPPYLSDQFSEINWLHFLSLWEQLPDSMRRVGELVGVEEQFIGRKIQGHGTSRDQKEVRKLAVHQRFYASLALNDLIQEMPLSKVATKYNCTRGILQSLQQTTSTFAGMLTVFCNRLGWHNMELLFVNFQKRVHFGIQQELCDLVRLSTMNGQRARMFYNAGYETVAAVASSEPTDIATLLANSAPFESVKHDPDKSMLRKEKDAKHVWIPGHCGMSVSEAAAVIVKEARRMIEQELGVKNVQWKRNEPPDSSVKNLNCTTVSSSSGENSGRDTKCTSHCTEGQDSCLESQSVLHQQLDNVHQSVAFETSSHATATNENDPAAEKVSKSVIECKSIHDEMYEMVESPSKRRRLNHATVSCDESKVASGLVRKNGTELLKLSVNSDVEDVSLLLADSFSYRENGSKSEISYFLNNIDHFDAGNAVCEAQSCENPAAEVTIFDEKEEVLTQAAEMESISLSDSFYSKLQSLDCDSQVEAVSSKKLDRSDNQCRLSHSLLYSSTPVEKEILKCEGSKVRTSWTLDDPGRFSFSHLSTKSSLDQKTSRSKNNSPNFCVNALSSSHNEKEHSSCNNTHSDSTCNKEESNHAVEASDDDTGDLFTDNAADDNPVCPDTEQLLGDSLFLTLAENLEQKSEKVHESGCQFDESPYSEKNSVKNTHTSTDPNFVLPMSMPPPLYTGTSAKSGNISPHSLYKLDRVEYNAKNEKPPEDKALHEASGFSFHLDSQVQFSFLKEHQSPIKPDDEPDDVALVLPPNRERDVSALSGPVPGKQSRDTSVLSTSSDPTQIECMSPTSPKGTKLSNGCCLSSDISKQRNTERNQYRTQRVTEAGNELETADDAQCWKRLSASSYDGDSDLFAADEPENAENVIERSLSSNVVEVKTVKNSDFAEFVCSWKNTKKFSFSVACEKYTAEHSVIGPKLLQSQEQMNDCKWIFENFSVVGFSICWEKDRVFYIPLHCSCLQLSTGSASKSCPDVMGDISDVFEKHLEGKTVILCDLKRQYRLLCSACKIVMHIKASTAFEDPLIACWLLDPSFGKASFPSLVSEYLPDEFVLADGAADDGVKENSQSKAKERACREAVTVFHLMDRLNTRLHKKKLHKAFTTIEMPIQLILAKMEQNGIGFDVKLAITYRSNLHQQQQLLSSKAHQLAGRKFNLGSSKDIARVIYKELRLSVPETGRSSPVANKLLAVGIPSTRKCRLPPEFKTNKETLEKLRHLHPLPEVILNWRKVSFCLSKVLIPMLKEKSFCSSLGSSRLHSTCYVYTVTGRVNTHSPNLQFVPRDFDVTGIEGEADKPDSECECDDELFGVTLRNMFVPCDGHVLIAADYSQLELRLLAHLSADSKLLSLLNSGSDVFKLLASHMKDIPVSEVNDNQRQQAKQICYSIIYGVSSKTLSKQLGFTEEEAAAFKECFMDAYPCVKNYLKKVTEECAKQGYVSTLSGRRRYLASINSEIHAERLQAERQAVNTTVQGSAADLVKTAMIKIELDLSSAFPGTEKPLTFSSGDKTHEVDSLKNKPEGAFLVLHLHDELIYEVQESNVYIVARIIKKNMENAMKLKVKLPVKVRVGTSWGKMTELNM